jgi:hypothetical protein
MAFLIQSLGKHVHSHCLERTEGTGTVDLVVGVVVVMDCLACGNVGWQSRMALQYGWDRQHLVRLSVRQDVKFRRVYETHSLMAYVAPRTIKCNSNNDK